MKPFLVRFICFLMLAGLLNGTAAFCAFLTNVPEAAAETRQLTYSANLNRKDVESFLGRKLTFGEKLGFGLNKEKFVAATNASLSKQANSAGDGSGLSGWAIAGMIVGALVTIGGLIYFLTQ